MRRSGKLFISVGSVILIIAGGCFVLYKSSSRADSVADTTSLHSYAVTWDVRQSSFLSISDFVDKKTVYSKSVSFKTPNIKDVIIRLWWIDDTVSFFGFFGRDALTLSVITPDGARVSQSARCARDTRQGFIELSIPVMRHIPASQTFQSADRLHAGEVLKTSFDYTWVDDEFTVQVSDAIGEFRPLRRLRDPGNDFTLEITNRYYQASLVGEEDLEPTSNLTTGNVLQTGLIPPSVCPFCDGGITHEPWCPYYEDPFEDDFFDDDDLFNDHSYRDPWEDDTTRYQPIPWDKPGRVILLYVMFLVMMYLSQVWVFGGML
jgi:hypothetical protein